MKTAATINTTFAYVSLRETPMFNAITGEQMVNEATGEVVKTSNWRFGFADEFPAIGKDFAEIKVKAMDFPVAVATAKVCNLHEGFGYIPNVSAGDVSALLNGAKVTVTVTEYEEGDDYVDKNGVTKKFEHRCLRADFGDVELKTDAKEFLDSLRAARFKSILNKINNA